MSASDHLSSQQFYHVSPASNRESIQAEGLHAGEHGVWMYSDPERVRGTERAWLPFHGNEVQDMDVYQVQPHDTVHGSKARDEMSAHEHYPDDPVHVTYQDVEPERVQRVHPHTLRPY